MIKKDGRRVEFDRSKIVSGLIRACEKRPVSTETLESMVSEIEREVYSHYNVGRYAKGYRPWHEGSPTWPSK